MMIQTMTTGTLYDSKIVIISSLFIEIHHQPFCTTQHLCYKCLSIVYKYLLVLSRNNNKNLNHTFNKNFNHAT